MVMMYDFYQHYQNTERLSVKQRSISGRQLAHMINDDYKVRDDAGTGKIYWRARVGLVGERMIHLFARAGVEEDMFIGTPDGERAFKFQLLSVNEEMIDRGMPVDENSLFAYEMGTPFGFDGVVRFIYDQDDSQNLFYFFHYAKPQGDNWPIVIAPLLDQGLDTIRLVSSVYQQASRAVKKLRAQEKK